MNIDLSAFTNLLNANIFIDIYNNFLGLFPSSIHWLVSLIILVSIAVALFTLISSSWLFIIVAIVLFPVIYPVLRNFLGELFTFILYLWNFVANGIPKIP